MGGCVGPNLCLKHRPKKKRTDDVRVGDTVVIEGRVEDIDYDGANINWIRVGGRTYVPGQFRVVSS